MLGDLGFLTCPPKNKKFDVMNVRIFHLVVFLQVMEVNGPVLCTFTGSVSASNLSDRDLQIHDPHFSDPASAACWPYMLKVETSPTSTATKLSQSRSMPAKAIKSTRTDQEARISLVGFFRSNHNAEPLFSLYPTIIRFPSSFSLP